MIKTFFLGIEVTCVTGRASQPMVMLIEQRKLFYPNYCSVNESARPEGYYLLEEQPEQPELLTAEVKERFPWGYHKAFKQPFSLWPLILTSQTVSCLHHQP